jgi:hypothetical protein
MSFVSYSARHLPLPNCSMEVCRITLQTAQSNQAAPQSMSRVEFPDGKQQAVSQSMRLRKHAPKPPHALHHTLTTHHSFFRTFIDCPHISYAANGGHKKHTTGC